MRIYMYARQYLHFICNARLKDIRSFSDMYP